MNGFPLFQCCLISIDDVLQKAIFQIVSLKINNKAVYAALTFLTLLTLSPNPFIARGGGNKMCAGVFEGI